jgi:hypothetical protein
LAGPAGCGRAGPERCAVSDLIFLLLAVILFAALGLAVKAVERM